MKRGESKQVGAPKDTDVILAILQYGHSDWTINMIDSVVSNNQRLQIVVLDQGSALSDTTNILNCQETRDDLTVLCSPTNLGIPMGWNTIIRFCLQHCDNVLIAPNDIIYRSDTIDVLMEEWKNKPFDNIISISSVWMGEKRDNKLEDFETQKFNPSFGWSWTGFNSLITPEFIQKVGWYDEDLGPWWWNDTDMLLRIFKSGNVPMVANHSKVWLTNHSTKVETVPRQELSKVYNRNKFRFAVKHGLSITNIHEEKQWQHHYEVKTGEVIPKPTGKFGANQETFPYERLAKSFLGDSQMGTNESRIRHLHSLRLNFRGKSVLEAGAGIGLLTEYFTHRSCKILSTDGRPENVAAVKRLWPEIETKLIDLDKEKDLSHLGQFEIVFCYGLLYHFAEPARSLEMLANVCDRIMIVESKTSSAKDVDSHPLPEPDLPDQALHGMGCRPTRKWIVDTMGSHFEFVYIPTNTSEFLNSDRFVCIGTRKPVESQRQEKLERVENNEARTVLERLRSLGYME